MGNCAIHLGEGSKTLRSNSPFVLSQMSGCWTWPVLQWSCYSDVQLILFGLWNSTDKKRSVNLDKHRRSCWHILLQCSFTHSVKSFISFGHMTKINEPFKHFFITLNCLEFNSISSKRNHKSWFIITRMSCKRKAPGSDRSHLRGRVLSWKLWLDDHLSTSGWQEEGCQRPRSSEQLDSSQLHSHSQALPPDR